MLNYLADFVHFISEKQYVVLILGYLGCHRSKFARITIVSLFSIIVASFLKSIFKHKLPPGMHDGWALPSTHLMFSIVLWFSIAWEFRSILVSLAAFLVCGLIAWALLYSNYHYPLDLLAALLFGFTLLGTFYIIIANWPRAKEYEAYMFLGLVGCTLTYFNSMSDEWKFYIWGICSAIFGVSLGFAITYSNNINVNNNKIFKTTRAIMGLAGFYLIIYIFNNLDINQRDNTTAFFQYFLLALWVSLFTEQLSKPLNKMFMNEKAEAK